MFCISLIHKTGGTKTILGKTMQECRDSAAKHMYLNNYLAATIPYTVYSVEKSAMYDVSIPFEIKKSLGIEMRFILEDKE